MAKSAGTSLKWSAPEGGSEASPLPAAEASRHVAKHRSTFWLSFWLAVILVVTKAFHLGLPELSYDGLIEYGRDLAIISYADVLFAFAVGLVGQVAVLLASRPHDVTVWDWFIANLFHPALAEAYGRTRWPRVERTIWVVLVLFCAISAVYAVLSVQVFAYLRSPLSYPLLYVAGDAKNMRSSVNAFLTVPFVTGLVGITPLYLLVALVTHRWIQPNRTRAFRKAQGLGIIAVLLYALVARQTAAGTWSDRDDRLIAANPHWYLVHSCVTELLGGGTVLLSETFPPEDLEDFQIVAERRGGLLEAEDGPIQPPRNVIVLVLESTGTQYLSLYGSRYATTPRLEAEATHALVFNNFYCHVGLTANALVAIALSVYPGMTWREYTVEHPGLPGTTLAEVLRPRGYRTAFIHNGDLEYTNQRGFLENRGFDNLWDYHDLGCGPPTPEFSWGVEDRCLVDGIFNWIDRDRSRPFCVLAWTIQAHHPYELRPATETDFFQGDLPPDAYDLGRYLNVLSEVDRQLGRLFDGLRARNLADDTLVVIVGDHGEAFGYPHDTYGHGGKLYQENIHVPLILWNPRLYPAGQRSDMVGSQVDLNPTIVDLLGVGAPYSWQGRSLFDPQRPPRAYFYAANDDYLLGVRDQNWKYIYNAKRGREELFDLASDPTEQQNVALEYPERCQRMRQRLAAWMDYEKRYLAQLHGSRR